MYIGNSPAGVGNYQVVDDISSTFNGVLTSFALTASSLAINPAKSGQLLVSINGVLQEPDDTGTEGFKVSGSNIVFSSAPATGSTFWAVWQGQAVDIGTPSDNTVGNAQVADDALSGNKIDGGTISNFTSTGIDDNATSTAITIADTDFIIAPELTLRTGQSSIFSKTLDLTTTLQDVVQVGNRGSYKIRIVSSDGSGGAYYGDTTAYISCSNDTATQGSITASNGAMLVMSWKAADGLTASTDANILQARTTSGTGNQWTIEVETLSRYGKGVGTGNGQATILL